MIREAIGTAKTVDEAINAGCLLLGVDRDKVEFEIIDLPKRGFFIRKDAKVRVFLEVPDPKPAPAPRAEAPRPKAPAPAQTRQAAPKPEQRQEQRAPRQDKQPSAPLKQEARPERGERPKQNQPKPQPQRQEPREPVAPVTITPTPELTAKAELAVSYVGSILKAMGLETAEVRPVFTQNGISLALSGEGLGVIIGRRGETLDSLQYLAGLVANRLGGDYVRITIDSGNYRQKRETTLEGLARKLANQVVRSGKSTTLEPMNPYERRIIHAAVSQVRGATSSSVGEEPTRRVVISATGDRPTGEDRRGGGNANGNNRGGDRRGGSRGPRGGRGGNGNNRGDDRRDKDISGKGGYKDYRDDRPARPAQQVERPESPKPVEAPAATATPTESKQPFKERSLHEAEFAGNLYGKIEL